LTLNISQTATDTAIVTIEGEYETASKLSNGINFNDDSQTKNLRAFTGPPTAAGDVSLRAAGCGPSTDVAEAPRPAR